MGGVCRKLYNYITYNFLIIFLCKIKYFYYLCMQREQQTRTFNPSNYNNMIIKHLQGGGYRLPLPPSMQCVARLAIPAILFLLTVSLSSCATAKKGDEIRVYNKVGTEQL